MLADLVRTLPCFLAFNGLNLILDETCCEKVLHQTSLQVREHSPMSVLRILLMLVAIGSTAWFALSMLDEEAPAVHVVDEFEPVARPIVRNPTPKPEKTVSSNSQKNKLPPLRVTAELPKDTPLQERFHHTVLSFDVTETASPPKAQVAVGVAKDAEISGEHVLKVLSRVCPVKFEPPAARRKFIGRSFTILDEWAKRGVRGNELIEMLHASGMDVVFSERHVSISFPDQGHEDSQGQ